MGSVLGGGVAALFAFLWVFRITNTLSERRQLILSGLLISVILLLAFFVSRRNLHNPDEIILGKWISDDADLVVYDFYSADSVRVEWDTINLNLSYEFLTSDEVAFTDDVASIEFNWKIKSIQPDRVIAIPLELNGEEEIILTRNLRP